MITKYSKEITLQEHQQRVLDKLDNPNLPGLIAYHSMGSGKTLTALKALQAAREHSPDKKGLFIVPASLQENVWKEIAKHELPLTSDDLDVLSYEKATKHIDDLLKSPRSLVVFDEAHRLRNANTARVRNLRKLLGNTDKSLLLTGTAGYNNPADIAALVKLLNPESEIPANPAEFARKYIDDRAWKLRNKKELGQAISPYIDVYERPRTDVEFPAVYERTYNIPMSEKQTSLYKYVEGKLPPHLRYKVRENLPLTIQEMKQLNTFATGVRQVSDSTVKHDVHGVPEDSPKLVAAVESMVSAAKAPRFRGVAYSNFIDSGINPYADLLRKRGIEPYIVTGSIPQKEKKHIVETFNKPGVKPKVMLLSSSGGEGLDLKGVRKLQILDPHFNQAKIDQVKGRGARYQSHVHLPENERNIYIEEYMSTMPPTFWQKLFHTKTPTTIDTYLHDASTRKQNIIDEIRGSITSEHGA